MRIGIIGAGVVGQTVGRLLAEAGHDLVVSWSSSRTRLQLAADQIGFGTRTASPADAVAYAEAVLFAPRFEHVSAASRAAGPFFGKPVIDTTNASACHDRPTAELVAVRLPGARYVKGFNTLPATFLAETARRTGPDRVVIFLSGDDFDAKAVAGALVRDAGFEPVDLGSTADSVRQQPPWGDYYDEEFHLDDVPYALRSRSLSASASIDAHTSRTPAQLTS